MQLIIAGNWEALKNDYYVCNGYENITEALWNQYFHRFVPFQVVVVWCIMIYLCMKILWIYKSEKVKRYSVAVSDCRRSYGVYREGSGGGYSRGGYDGWQYTKDDGLCCGGYSDYRLYNGRVYKCEYRGCGVVFGCSYKGYGISCKEVYDTSCGGDYRLVIGKMVLEKMRKTKIIFLIFLHLIKIKVDWISNYSSQKSANQCFLPYRTTLEVYHFSSHQPVIPTTTCIIYFFT